MNYVHRAHCPAGVGEYPFGGVAVRQMCGGGGGGVEDVRRGRFDVEGDGCGGVGGAEVGEDV